MNDNNKPDNPPAFPVESLDRYHSGMSLRDYFAGQTLSAVVAVGLSKEARARFAQEHPKGTNGDAIAEHCYAMADCMLKQREVK